MTTCCILSCPGSVVLCVVFARCPAAVLHVQVFIVLPRVTATEYHTLPQCCSTFPLQFIAYQLRCSVNNVPESLPSSVSVPVTTAVVPEQPVN